MQDRDSIAEQHGFYPLGPITLASQRALRFPSPPAGGGLYLIDLNAGGKYIGETARYGKDGSKSGRFNHYANPADDIWTELVIHEMLLAGGGYVHILPAEGDKKFRLRLEAEKIAAFVAAGVPLWNNRAGRCQRTYLSWHLPIAERMYAFAVKRYDRRVELAPYASGRLTKLRHTLSTLRAEAQALGLSEIGPMALSSVRAKPNLNSVIGHSATHPPERRMPRSQLPAEEPRAANINSAIVIVHRYLAEHRNASLDELHAALPGWIKPITSRTLWNDFRMTLEAIQPGKFAPAELRTLTIRRVVYELWQQDPTNVTKEAVDHHLRKLERIEKMETVSAIVGNVMSSLRAMARRDADQGI